MFQLIAAVLMAWVLMASYLQWKPLQAELHDDGTYVHIRSVARVCAVLSVFTVFSWGFIEFAIMLSRS